MKKEKNYESLITELRIRIGNLAGINDFKLFHSTANELLNWMHTVEKFDELLIWGSIARNDIRIYKLIRQLEFYGSGVLAFARHSLRLETDSMILNQNHLGEEDEDIDKFYSQINFVDFREKLTQTLYSISNFYWTLLVEENEVYLNQIDKISYEQRRFAKGDLIIPNVEVTYDIVKHAFFFGENGALGFVNFEGVKSDFKSSKNKGEAFLKLLVDSPTRKADLKTTLKYIESESNNDFSRYIVYLNARFQKSVADNELKIRPVIESVTAGRARGNPEASLYFVSILTTNLPTNLQQLVPWR
ncbi:hypothetical protein A2956_02480 [Candidatus Roizmanbacteria bacterium RIFCSPLOWO2_01_FULL_37_57]|nr:MAG: hypothetical protein A2956_02480 [Candidatus Roizmanbacteria bacterium RIFCSPLOWO2_01_FULL_37_57]